MHAAEGILTTRGGMTSHAAVVARGMGKPCVSGAGGIRVDYAPGDALTAAGCRSSKKGEIVTIDGSTGQVMKGEVADHQAGAFRRLRHHHGMGRQGAPHEGARQCRDPARCPGRARFRRRRHRPLPHRAHVLRCRSHRRDARDDPGPKPKPAAARRSPRSCRCSARISSSLFEIMAGLAGHHPAARPALA